MARPDHQPKQSLLPPVPQGPVFQKTPQGVIMTIPMGIGFYTLTFAPEQFTNLCKSYLQQELQEKMTQKDTQAVMLDNLRAHD